MVVNVPVIGMGIALTPWGAWGQAVAAGRTLQLRKGLEGFSHGVWPHGGQTLGPERGSAEPRKARFFAKQKMRPNEVLKSLLYLSVHSLQMKTLYCLRQRQTAHCR
jgi:hypothetical protein